MATFNDAVAEFFGVEGFSPPVEFIVGIVGASIVVSIMLTIIGVSAVWLKRKWNARLGDRIAVNRIGPAGLMVMPADALKLFSKEVVVPEGVDRVAYFLAPMLAAATVLAAFAFIPFGSGLQVADPETGLVFALAFASLGAIPIVMAGYSSKNKYSFLGFEREVAQAIAYEIPLVVSALAVVPLVAVFAETDAPLRMSNVVAAQQGPLFGVSGLPIPNWFVFAQPIAAVLFFVAILAEFSRNPFDLPEAGSELVAGYLTEYGGVNFVLLFLAEFAAIFFGGALFTALFLGGGSGPLLPAAVWFLGKTFVFYLVVQWFRATIPRVRIDQLLDLGWKYLLELTFLNLLLTAGVLWVVL
ncbi:MAG: complex I subunit 1/NuoH family protein [Halobacteriales archaeon]